MRVAVFGAGYVGLVTGACLADLGHDVVVRDIVSEKIDACGAAEGADPRARARELLERNASGSGSRSRSHEALDEAEVVYVAVGTPPTASGDADLTAVWTVVDELPRVDRRIVLAMKSTVPVGTGRTSATGSTSAASRTSATSRTPSSPPRGRRSATSCTPTGSSSARSKTPTATSIEELHAGIDAPVVRCDVNSAEMIKLAANAALVTRDLVHQRDRERLRGDGRRRPEGRRRHRPRPPDRPAVPARRASATAARASRRIRSRSSSSRRTPATASSS